MFESAARNVSFAAAGEELFITASAVSHQIKSLEQYLGFELFSRKHRKVMLTAKGQNYFNSVQQSLNELEVATLRMVDNPKTDIVTLNVAPNFLVRWLIPRLQGFQDLHPDVELQMTASNDLIDFTSTNIDMAVYFGHGDWHGVDVHFLNRVFLVPVCTQELLDRSPVIEEPKDLRAFTLIHVTKRLHEWPEWLESAKVKYRGFSRGLHLSSSQLATSAALEGLGVALADSTLSSREIDNGRLVQLFDVQLDTLKSFYLVHQKNRPLSYGMEAFLNWVMDEMKQ